MAVSIKEYLKKKNHFKYSKFLVLLKIHNYFKSMDEEIASHNCGLKKINETRKLFSKK